MSKEQFDIFEAPRDLEKEGIMIPAIDHFIAITEKLKEKGKDIQAIFQDDGALRRYFNETIKNTDRMTHDKMNPWMSKHAEELETAIVKHIEEWTKRPENENKEIVTEDFINEFGAIFAKLDDELKNDPKWKKFWDELSPKPENVEHVKERILMAYRFKMFQMITNKYKVLKEPVLGKDKAPVVDKDNNPVMKPKYQTKLVASIDIVLQKLNGAYDRRHLEKINDGKEDRPRTLVEQFRKEYQDESGPSYITDLNGMIGVAIEMKRNGASKTEIDEYLEKARKEAQQNIVKGDKYAKYVGRAEAEKLFNELFYVHRTEEQKLQGKPLSLSERVDEYDKVSKEMGFDLHTYAKLLDGCKETKLPTDVDEEHTSVLALSSEDKKVLDTYVAMLRSKVYYKGHENHKNQDIFVPFDEKRFNALTEQVKGIINNNPFVLANKQGLLKNYMFQAMAPKPLAEGQQTPTPKTAEELKRDFENVKKYVQLGGDLGAVNDQGLTVIEVAKTVFSPEQVAELRSMYSNDRAINFGDYQQFELYSDFRKGIIDEYQDYFKADDALLKTYRKFFDNSDQHGQAMMDALNKMYAQFLKEGSPSQINVYFDQELAKNLPKSIKFPLTTIPGKEQVGAIMDVMKSARIKAKELLEQNLRTTTDSTFRECLQTRTPLHTFIDKTKGKQLNDNEIKALKTLINYCVNQKNVDGIKPMEHAIMVGNRQMINVLSVGGSDFKTSQYERPKGIKGFFTKLRDAFSGIPGNFANYWNNPPPIGIDKIREKYGEEQVDKAINAEKELLEKRFPPIQVPEKQKTDETPQDELILSEDVVKTLVKSLDEEYDSGKVSTQTLSESLVTRGPPPYTEQFSSSKVEPITPLTVEKPFAQQCMDKIRAHYPTIDVGGTGSLQVNEKRSLLSVFSLLKEYEHVPLEKGSDQLKEFQRKLEDRTKIEVKEPVKGIIEDLKKSVDERVTKKSTMRMSGTGGD